MNKPQLRKHISDLLINLPKVEKETQSKNVKEKLLRHPLYKSAEKISIYLSTSNEVDTISILEQAIEVDKKQCFVPLVRKTKSKDLSTRMVMIRLNSMTDYHNLPLNHYGIKEPNVETGNSFIDNLAHPISNKLDLVIVPGVAFSPDGRRLGHGKGYYDEFLSNWSKEANEKRLQTIGLAFREQIREDLPVIEGHDYTLDEILIG